MRGFDRGSCVLPMTAIIVRFSPGLRFGDQILQINDESVAGYDMDKVHGIFKKARSDAIKVGSAELRGERERGRGLVRVGEEGCGYCLWRCEGEDCGNWQYRLRGSQNGSEGRTR